MVNVIMARVTATFQDPQYFCKISMLVGR